MSATSVLEREEQNSPVAQKMADEAHNARIKRNYAMLINPDAKIDEVLGRSAEEQAQVFAPAAAPAEYVEVASEVIVNKPYLVENARADAAIFRADNPINRRVADVQPVQMQADDEEEENEDLRPTSTTIQYRTVGVQSTVEEGKIENVAAEKRSVLSKKEKIIIAVVVTVIVALLALIIVNSAIISNLNNSVSTLQSSLTTIKGAYSGISDQVNEYSALALDKVEEFARVHGMVKLG